VGLACDCREELRFACSWCHYDAFQGGESRCSVNWLVWQGMILFLYIFVMNILALNDMFNINCITDYAKNVKEDQMTAIP
jgi:hypothetical protein